MPSDGHEPLAARLRRLRADRGLSRSQLSRRTVEIDGKGLPEITIKDLETTGRQSKMSTIELLAAALDVPPEEFYEYRLAVARRELDEREVGLGQALSMLEQIEPALRPALAATRLEAERTEASDRRRREGRSARPRRGR